MTAPSVVLEQFVVGQPYRIMSEDQKRTLKVMYRLISFSEGSSGKLS